MPFRILAFPHTHISQRLYRILRPPLAASKWFSRNDTLRPIKLPRRRWLYLDSRLDSLINSFGDRPDCLLTSAFAFFWRRFGTPVRELHCNLIIRRDLELAPSSSITYLRFDCQAVGTSAFLPFFSHTAYETNSNQFNDFTLFKGHKLTLRIKGLLLARET